MGEKEKQAGRVLAEGIARLTDAIKAGKITQAEAVSHIADRLEVEGVLSPDPEGLKDLASGTMKRMVAISKESGSTERFKELVDLYGDAGLEMLINLYHPELRRGERSSPLDHPSIGPDIPPQFRDPLGLSPMVRDSANAQADEMAREGRERRNQRG